MKQSINILLVDDESLMLEVLSLTLTKLGFTTITSADSGHSALQKMESMARSPDLILLDINMPEMDGIQFIRKLVENRYDGSLVLVSGENERMVQTVEKLVRAHQIKVLGYIQKPVTLEALNAMLGSWNGAPQTAQQATANKTYSADELHAAIAGGELVNYYQPKVAVSTGEVVGVEALVRWRHPIDGMVFPDQFINVAETHGLIDDLTDTVLREALAQAKCWQDSGLHLMVAVNISMDNLVSLDFPDIVSELTAAAGMVAEDLILEITESRLIQDLRSALDILTRLRLKRFGLAIDDFGTGHSSMTQLQNIPFNELKVDRSFVHRAHANPTALAIYNASLTLAKQLGMQVVAEGVEDRDDWDLLRRTSCDIAQGYFIAKPMPAADVAAWVARWRERWILS